MKYCGKCGSALVVSSELFSKELSPEEKFKRIQRYLPKDLTEKILAQKEKIEGERKQVTIMFCDMKEFTPLAEKLGPEKTFSLMDNVFELLIHKVYRYGGTVNEIRGDGILGGWDSGPFRSAYRTGRGPPVRCTGFYRHS
jgi:class 3 adenylate cyclase